MTQTSYTYDLGERLTAITPASGSPATFSFDSLGRRATRVVGSSTDSYTYLGSTSTLAGISSGGVMTASLLDADGSRLANKDLSSAAATFSLPDLHGSLAAAQLTGSTTLAVAYRYDAYGQTLASGGSGGGPEQPYRYQGRLDISPAAAEPLYAAGARAYQPSLGVFTQLDTHPGSAQDPLSLNRYLYAEANPTSLTDPDGHAAISGADLQGSDRTYYTTTPASPGQPPTTVEHDIWAPRPQPIPPHWKQHTDVNSPLPPCSSHRLNCAPLAIDGMSIMERSAWLQAVADQNGAHEWFNNIQDVLRFSREQGLSGSGTWFSTVDSYILTGIQDGAALNTGLRVRTKNPGALLWKKFFSDLRARSAEEILLLDWGAAEQASTDYGVAEAGRRGIAAPFAEFATLKVFGDVYRAGVAHNAAAQIVGGAIGGVSGAAPGLACGPLAPACMTAGFTGGTFAGSSAARTAFDPRNSGWAYWLTTGVYAEVRGLGHPISPLPLGPVLLPW